MIVRQDKRYEKNSMFPNTNFTEQDNVYVVDETTEEGKILVDKIQAHAPYFDFVLDEEGNLIDITPLPKPEPEIVDESVDDEKIAMAEAIIDLNMRIEELENRLNGGV